ncbi:SET and MYND domain-containing protein 3 [Nowakowskiella sp. JEL0407]|nr:SET and MYND domain-containing protein 3 [Nowakowskiella sp. JEL0407]
MEEFLSKHNLKLVYDEKYSTRRLITFVDIQLGKVVFESSALGVAGVSQRRCWGCINLLESSSNAAQCAACKRAKYCSRVCQAKDWNLGHKEICWKWRFRKTKKSLEFENDEEMLLKVVLAVMKRKNERPSEYKIEQLDLLIDTFETLESHVSDYNPNAIIHMKDVADSVLTILNERKFNISDLDKSLSPADILLNYLGRFKCNNFSIHDSQLFGDIGDATFPLGALLNHSCVSNCSMMYDFGNTHGVRQIVRAIRNIKAGEELTDSYVDGISERSDRIRDLEERYCFRCECEKCLINDDESKCSGYAIIDRHEASVDAIRNHSSKIAVASDLDFVSSTNFLVFHQRSFNSAGTDRLALAFNPTLFSSFVIQKLTPFLPPEYKQKESLLRERLTFIKTLHNDRHKETVTKLFSISLKSLPVPATYPFPDVVWSRQTFQILSPLLYRQIEENDWKNAAILSQYVLALYLLHYQSFHPLVGIQWFLYGKCLWNYGADREMIIEAWKVLNIARECLIISHGTGEVGDHENAGIVKDVEQLLDTVFTEL